MKENVSQKVLVEVLLREVQALQMANKELQHSIPVMKAQIDSLKNTRLIAQVNTQPLTKFNVDIVDRLKEAGEVAKVDTKPMEEFKTWLNARLKNSFVIPSWIGMVSSIVVVWALITTGMSFYYHRLNKENEAAKNEIYAQLKACQGENPKGNKK